MTSISSSVPITIRPMAFSEIRDAIRIFSDHDLVESLSVVQSFHKSDPDAFLVAVRGDKVIGSIGAPLTTQGTRFVGLYAVDKKYHKMGIGKRLFHQAMETIVREQNCGLVSVPDKFDIYKNRCGFGIEEGVSIEFFEGVPQLDGLKSIEQLGEKFELVEFDQENVGENLVKRIVEYDAVVHEESRETLMRMEMEAEDTLTVGILDREEDKLVGFGCVRPDFLERPMLGPIYADSPEIAEVITEHLLASDPDYSDSDILLVTTSNSQMRRIAQNILQLPFVERDAKLYTQRIPPLRYDLLYCCHTPSFAC